MNSEPKKSWFRWLALRLLIAAASYAALYAALSWHFTRATEQELSWFRAQGCPTTADDLNAMRPKPVPQTDNAGPLWQAAVESYRATDGFHRSSKWSMTTLVNGRLTGPPLTTDEIGKLKELIRDNAETFSLLRQAAARPGYNSPVDYNAGFELRHRPDLPGILDLCRFIRLSALQAAVDGDLDTAIERWAALADLRRWLCDESSLIAKIATDAEDRMLCDSVQSVLSCRKLSAAQLARVQKLLPPLVDARAQMKRAIGGEQAWGLNLMNIFLGEAPDPAESNNCWAVRLIRSSGPVSLWTKAMRLNNLNYHHTVLVESQRMPLSLTPTEKVIENLPWYARLSNQSCVFMNSILMKMVKTEAVRRTTAWGLALQRQKLATGSYPEKLSDLKPEFAAGLGEPLDPFTNLPLVYRRQGEGFIIYSVGPNLNDDGGPAKGNDDIGFDLKD